MSEEVLDLIDELYEKGRENGISFFTVSITESQISWSASVSNTNRKNAAKVISNLVNVVEQELEEG